MHFPHLSMESVMDYYYQYYLSILLCRLYLNIIGSKQQTQMGQYCYWDIRSEPDLVIIIVYLVISTVLMGFIIRAYIISKKYIQSGTVFRVYYYLAAWYVAYLVEYIFGIVIYAKHKFKEQITKYSTIFEFMDFFPAFLLMGCLFFVSSLLYARILTVSQNLRSNITKSQKIFKKFITYYQFLRCLYIIPTLVLLILGQKSEQEMKQKIDISSNIEVGFYLLDSVICNITLWIVMSTMRKKNKELGLSNEQQKIKLRRQTILLQFAGFIRFIFGLFFIFLNNRNINKDDCPQSSTFRSILYMLVGQFIMDSLPILVILSIFSITKEQVQRTLSDMDSSSQILDQP